MDDIELPPLPKPVGIIEVPMSQGNGCTAEWAYTAEQVRAAQRAAVIADRARRVSAEPVAWASADLRGMLSHHLMNSVTDETRLHYTVPLYAAPPPTPSAEPTTEQAQAVAAHLHDKYSCWHGVGALDVLEVWRKLTEQAPPPTPPACEHVIADATNAVITSGYMCVKCGAMFAAAGRAAHPARRCAGGDEDGAGCAGRPCH